MSTTLLVVAKSHADAAQSTDAVAAALTATPSASTRPPSARPSPTGKRKPVSAPPPPSPFMVTGPAIATPHGVVQVRISVTGNRLTDIIALQYAVGGRSTEINEWAIPLLRQEALSAQNARLHTLSGATYTSNAYKMSLQAALDAAAAGHHD